MNRQRFFVLLIAALIAIGGALWLTARRNPIAAAQEALLLPSLAGELNAVTEVILRKGSAPPVTLKKSAAGWTVAERADYPADVAKLRNLLSALGDAKIVEEKTADPARYAVLGLDDPGQPGAGTEITVAAPSGRQAVIVGKSVGEGNFVRRVGAKQSYSVEPAIPVEVVPQAWIDTRLLDVPVAKIQSIEFKPGTGAAYAIHRAKGAVATFGLDGAPAGRKPLEANALAPAATTFAGLTAEDVAPLNSIDFSHAFTTVLTLEDGDVVTLAGSVSGDKHWVQIDSSKQPAEAARTRGRAFEIAGYRYETIFRPLEQLLAPKDPPAPKAPSAAPPHAPKKN